MMSLPANVVAAIEREAFFQHTEQIGYTKGATVWATRCLTLLQALQHIKNATPNDDYQTFLAISAIYAFKDELNKICLTEDKA